MKSSIASRPPQVLPGQLANRLYGIVGALVLTYAVTLLVLGEAWQRQIAPLLILGCALLAGWLGRGGQRALAMPVFVWGVWGAITLQAIVRLGIGNPSLYAYPALFLLGGWVLGLRQGVALGIASVLATMMIALAEQEGWIAGRTSVPAMMQWIPIALVFATSMAAMYFVLAHHWDNVQRMEALNGELRHTVAVLSAREQALQQSEQRFAQIVASNPLPVAVSRLDDGVYLDVNPAWVRNLGWTEAEAVGRSSLELGFWQDAAERVQWVDDLRRDGRTLDRALTAVTRDGRQRHLSLSAELMDYNGQTCALTIFVDQTERLQIERDIRELNEQLESRVQARTRELSDALATLQQAQDELVLSAKLASLGQLVAGVAHELNTPIGNALVTATTLTDASRALLQQVRSGSMTRSSLERSVGYCEEGSVLIGRSLQRAADLLSSFKQVAVDQTSERYRRFDLATVVAEVIDTLRPNFKGVPWTLQVDIEPGLEVEGYPGPLGQVVINLVMNAALHAFDDGRRAGTVRVSARLGDQQNITLLCEDDGSGISADNLPRIFDPFFTTRLGHGGSGLGLAIVYRLVTQVLQGQISVQSRVGQGSSFQVRFPRVVARPDTKV